MAREHNYLVKDCYRLADEARRLAQMPGIAPEEKADLLEVQERWLSIARARENGGSTDTIIARAAS
jgi:hypothetical protein